VLILENKGSIDWIKDKGSFFRFNFDRDKVGPISSWQYSVPCVLIDLGFIGDGNQ
jgi:hypothetical protein